MDNIENSGNIKCSFCQKNKDEVIKLIAGDGSFICNECVFICGRILSSHEESMKNNAKKGRRGWSHLPKPAEIMGFLDDYIVGQREAKKTIAVAVYNHYKRLANNETEDCDIEISKSNILMIGPTGCGKTLIAETVARMLDVVMVIVDATTMTETGYVGEDVEGIIVKVLQKADFDIERAQRAIVYIDEVDKITRKSVSPSMSRDISGEGVQQALLKMIEGTQVMVHPHGNRKTQNQEMVQVDTTNILFICGGAFDGLDEVIRNRTNAATFGFGVDVPSKDPTVKRANISDIETEDLIKYGLIPEFVGRLPVITTLDGLDKESLFKIMVQPKNAILKQYTKLFSIDGVRLEVSNDGILAIAAKAIKKKSGARALRSVLEKLFLDVMFEIPGDKTIIEVRVDEEVVDGKKPIVVCRSPSSGGKLVIGTIDSGQKGKSGSRGSGSRSGGGAGNSRREQQQPNNDGDGGSGDGGGGGAI